MIRTTDDHTNITFVFCVCFMKEGISSHVFRKHNSIYLSPHSHFDNSIGCRRCWLFATTLAFLQPSQCHWSQNLTACTFGQKIEWYRNIDMIQSLNFPCPVLLETSVWPPQTWNTLVTKYQTVSKELEVRWSMGKYAFTSTPPLCFLQILQNAGTGQLAIQVNSKLQRGQQSWSARDWQLVPIIKLYWTRKTHKNSV